MTQTKQFVLAALFSSTSAVSLSYRPPEGSVPWTKPLTVPNFEDVKTHPVNYFVPDFGVDTDIIDATDSIKNAETTLKKTLNATFDQKENPLNPRNYFVPDFGKDHEIIYTQNSIAQAENALGAKMHATFGDEVKSNGNNPRNYFVPDFGQDHEIIYTQDNIANAEKKLNHQLNASFGDDAKKNDVNPRNYFVPDFGMDHEIIYTQNSISQSEKALKHNWNPQFNGDYWVNMPAVDANSSYTQNNVTPEDSQATKVNGSTAFKSGSFAQTEEKPAEHTNIQLESDPICSSAGCTQYKQPEGKEKYPQDYFVPNFGQDHLIKESINSEEWASKEIGHTWVWQKVEKKDPVTYQINPLDVDMQASLHNLRMEEAIHGEWELPKEDSNLLIDMQSDPICSSAGCTQYKQPEGKDKHPIDYFVPDFGMDHDIKDSFTGLKVAETQLNHNWNWQKVEKPEWEKPLKVPDFGVDEEIKYAQEGEKWAENELGYKWKPTQDENGFWNVPS